MGNAKRNKKTAVIDELSTIPGAKVIVTPTGTVKVKRKADPEWDSIVGSSWKNKHKSKNTFKKKSDLEEEEEEFDDRVEDEDEDKPDEDKDKSPQKNKSKRAE